MRLVILAATIGLLSCSHADLSSPSSPSSTPAGSEVTGTTVVAPGCVATSNPSSPGVVPPIATTAPPTPAGVAAGSTVAVGPLPFASDTTPDGQWAFVTTRAGVAVVDLRGSAPALTGVHALAQESAGIAVTPDGATVVVGTAAGLVLLDAHALETGADDVASVEVATPAAIDIAVAVDGRTAFSLSENAGSVTVVDLVQARAGHAAAAITGTIPAGFSPAGMALTPDGRELLVAAQAATRADASSPDVASGRLIVVDVGAARTDPAHAVVASVAAGCTPVRVAVDDQGIAWVAARGSDAVLGIDTAGLAGAVAGATRAVVPVGPAPVGIAVVDGHRLVVAASDRFAAAPHPSLRVVDAARARAADPAVIGSLPTGRFPRDVTASRDHRFVLVTDYDDGTLQVIPTGAVPAAAP